MYFKVAIGLETMRILVSHFSKIKQSPLQLPMIFGRNLNWRIVSYLVGYSGAYRVNNQVVYAPIPNTYCIFLVIKLLHQSLYRTQQSHGAAYRFICFCIQLLSVPESYCICTRRRADCSSALEPYNRRRGHHLVSAMVDPIGYTEHVLLLPHVRCGLHISLTNILSLLVLVDDKENHNIAVGP